MSKIIIKWVIILTYLHSTTESFHAIDVDEYRGLSTGNNTVSGRPAHKGEFSFGVIFFENEPKKVGYERYSAPICSGAVISERWILTTARPLGEYKTDTYFMLAGILKIGREILESEIRNIYHIEAVIVHPEWHEYDYNDIGIARTSRKLRFGKELSVLKTPSAFTVPNDNKTVCSMNIWAAESMPFLLGNYQSLTISKQEVKFIVANGSKFCSDSVFPNKTLCLIQQDENKRKDICSVNYGAVIRCSNGCQSVGLFTGFKGYRGCVDTPPLNYAAVNLAEYAEWIRMIKNTPFPHKHNVHKISESSFICLNAKLTYLSFTFILAFY